MLGTVPGCNLGAEPAFRLVSAQKEQADLATTSDGFLLMKYFCKPIKQLELAQLSFIK